MESYLSNSPPWPGKIFPESFTLKFLFTLDINRSPNKLAIEINNEKRINKYILSKSK